MKRVVVFGNGQMAEIAHVYLAHDSPYEVVAFCVDKDHLQGDRYRGLPLIAFEDIERAYPPGDCAMFIPIGAKRVNHLRAEKYCQAKGKGYGFISYVSSKAIVCPETNIGENCFILENNVIQPFATIGNNVILWSGNHIGHHSVIMDHCFLTSHVVVCGRVTVESYSYLGVNSTVRDGLTIRESSVIGAGALLMRDTEPGQVYVGLPAKRHSLPSKSVDVF